MLPILITVGIAFLLQGLTGFMQMKHLTNEFIKLRRKGKVAFGRKSGGFRAGAVVMFLIDDEGIVQEAKKLEGTTAFARVKPLEGFEGRYIGSLKKEDGPDRHKNLCKAIEDAALTYRKYTAGELVEETTAPGPFQRAELVIGSLLDKTRKKAAVR